MWIGTLTITMITVTMTFVNGSEDGWSANLRENLSMNKFLERLRNDFQGNADALDLAEGVSRVDVDADAVVR